MIRHIVFFSAKNKEDAEKIATTLEGYSVIPGVKSLEIGRNQKVDGLANDVDVVLNACFETAEDLAAYKEHPVYQAGIDVVRPIRDMRIAADYVIS